MTSRRRRVATTIAGIVLAIGLTGCGGDDEAEQTDTGTTTGTTTGDTTTGETGAPSTPGSSSTGSSSTGSSSASTPGATMDPGKMTDENMPGMDHSGGGH